MPLPGHQVAGPQANWADGINQALETGVERYRVTLPARDAKAEAEANPPINVRIARYT